MTIQIDATKQLLAIAYKNQGAFLGLGIATDPQQPPTEAPSGPSLTYSREPVQWMLDAKGKATGSSIIKADPGTYTHAVLFSDATGGAIVDYCAFENGLPPFSTTGTVSVQLTYTQS